jgi:hypothetical protein
MIKPTKYNLMMQQGHQEQMKIINDQQLEMDDLQYYKDVYVDLFE